MGIQWTYTTQRLLAKVRRQRRLALPAQTQNEFMSGEQLSDGRGDRHVLAPPRCDVMPVWALSSVGEGSRFRPAPSVPAVLCACALRVFVPVCSISYS
jgi:hypothetical protein